MGSDGSENEEDWQAGIEPHQHAGTHNLWLVEIIPQVTRFAKRV